MSDDLSLLRFPVLEPCDCPGQPCEHEGGHVQATLSLAELEALLREQRLRSMPRFADQAEAVS